jgi:beta-N-acetylhexosaminidase
MKSKEQLTEMIANTITFSRYPLFFGVDEEGGTVSRLSSSGLAEGVSSAAQIGAANDPNNAYQAGLTTGENLASLGFNVDFAPVADIANIEGSVMAERSYGSDAALAAPYVTGMLSGLAEKGITGCLKHFPGIGATTADTHDGISTSERTAEEFRSQEFTVFQTGIEAGANIVMVGHIAAPALTGDNTPCSISEVIVTDILRQELGFEGVIITDAMDMGAISTYYDAGEAAIMALKAGCDMVLMPEDFEKAYQAVLQAVSDGTISEERINDSLKRIYRIKYAGMVTE